jgi:DNA-binding transcriptional ArsR family regulator
MSRTATGSDGVREVVVPDEPLDDDSVLTREDYLDMQAQLSNETRFRILRVLAANDEVGATALREALELPSNTFHYHLDSLVDAGLVRRLADKDPEDGRRVSYELSALGEVVLEHGVLDLMRRERELLANY